MDKRFGYYIFGGLLVGALLGLLWGSSGNLLAGLVVGAMVGLAIGWFAAAAVMEKEKKERK